MKELAITTRDIARELARKYSTMTHDELDILESILVPMRFAKGDMILKKGEVCTDIYYVDSGLVRQFYFKNDKDGTSQRNLSGRRMLLGNGAFYETNIWGDEDRSGLCQRIRPHQKSHV